VICSSTNIWSPCVDWSDKFKNIPLWNFDVSISHCYYSTSLQLFVINVANIQLRRLIYRDVCRRVSVSAGRDTFKKYFS